MKKLKMWYIKLAFAALFFTLIAESFVYFGEKKVSAELAPSASPAPIQSQIPVEINSEPKNAASVSDEEMKKVTAQLLSYNIKAYEYTLIVPRIGIQSGIVGTELTRDGKMDVPNNYTEVGWYSLGAVPGTLGSAVLGAHVDNGGSINGVFKNLKKLETGDSIFVANREGKLLHYKVVEKVVYDRNTKLTEKVFARNDVSRLNLITCYGTWLPKENTYSSRLVVFAELAHDAVNI